MATYTKETALYDTGAIATDIADAGTKASKYITKVDNAGISVHPYNDSSQSAVTADRATIDATGMTVYKNNVQRAKFGEDTIIGKPYDTQGVNNEGSVYIDYHSLQMIDKSGNAYLHISDLEDRDGNITENFTGDGTTTKFIVAIEVYNVVEVKINNIATSAYTRNGQAFTFTSAPTNGADISIKYTTQLDAKAFTFGTRISRQIGSGSVVEGIGTASGTTSHSEGSFTSAEGSNSHAEGFFAVAKGFNSHAQNLGTLASSEGQTALGQYNIEDTNDTFAVIVGNGTGSVDNPSRSNALAVDWNGNVRAKGDVYIGCNNDSTGGISLSSPTAITLTRTNNSYVNSTSFDRLKCYRIGNLAILYCNLQITTSLPSNSTFVKIGTISPAPKYDVNLIIPSQTSQAHVLLSINTSGEIQIWNGCGTATGVAFLRAMVPFIVD